MTSLLVAFIAIGYATVLSGGSMVKTYRLCRKCHERTISCHTPRTFNLGLLKKLWIESIHSNLMKEPFKNCPYLDCRRCPPPFGETAASPFSKAIAPLVSKTENGMFQNGNLKS